MDYRVTVKHEPRNLGHRMHIEGLAHALRRWDEYKGKDHEELLSQYDYEKTLPPFWSVGVAEVHCFTLPKAVYLAIYDLVQIHDDIRDGDTFRFEYEGETYVTIVNQAWPTCVEADELESALRKTIDNELRRVRRMDPITRWEPSV